MSKHIHAKAPWNQAKTACKKYITKTTWIGEGLDRITCPKCNEEIFDHIVASADDEVRVAIAAINRASSLYDELPDINLTHSNRALIKLLKHIISYSAKRK